MRHANPWAQAARRRVCCATLTTPGTGTGSHNGPANHLRVGHVHTGTEHNTRSWRSHTALLTLPLRWGQWRCFSGGHKGDGGHTPFPSLWQEAVEGQTATQSSTHISFTAASISSSTVHVDSRQQELSAATGQSLSNERSAAEGLEEGPFDVASTDTGDSGVGVSMNSISFFVEEPETVNDQHNALDLDLRKGEKIPLSAVTGRRFPPRAEEVLLQRARERQFTCPYWLPQDHATACYNAEVLLGEDPVDIGEGQGPVKLYNCKQIEASDLHFFLLSSPMPAECRHRPNNWVYINQHWTAYGDFAIQDMLDDAARRHFGNHRRWIDAQVIRQRRLSVRQMPTSVRTTTGSSRVHQPVDAIPAERRILLFNAEQTTAPLAVARSWEPLYTQKTSTSGSPSPSTPHLAPPQVTRNTPGVTETEKRLVGSEAADADFPETCTSTEEKGREGFDTTAGADQQQECFSSHSPRPVLPHRHPHPPQTAKQINHPLLREREKRGEERKGERESVEGTDRTAKRRTLVRTIDPARDDHRTRQRAKKVLQEYQARARHL